MGKSLKRVTKVLGVGAVLGGVVGVIRSVRRQPTPATTGTANWEPLAPATPDPVRNGPVQFAETDEPPSASPDEGPEPN
jgi:hypothetical protein